MRLSCTLSAAAKFAFWLLVVGLVLGLAIGFRALSADFESAAAGHAAGSATSQPHAERR